MSDGNASASSTNNPWTYADEPLTTMADDLLDHARLASVASVAMQKLAEQQASSVAALVGPWGSGKTSLLQAIENQLMNASWTVAHYNPWSHTSLDMAVTGFFQELQGALPAGEMRPNRRRALGNLGARMAPFGALAGVLGVDGEAVAAAMAELVKGEDSPEALRREAVKQLGTLQHPILVVVDDLDRLEPSELLLTFRLVRLLGRLPNVFYLLSYDERTLEDILQRTDLVGPDPGRARAYLEKMVQVRLEIPPMLPEQQLSLFDKGLTDLTSRYGLEIDAVGMATIQGAWRHCFQEVLTQPRAIKKLFAQITVTWPSVSGEVDFADFVLVSYLRTFEPQVLHLLHTRQKELTQPPSDYSRGSAPRGETHADRWLRWTADVCELSATPHHKAIMKLLALLFLPLKSARENVTYGSDSYERLRSSQRVGSSEYFNRYIQIGVTGDDIPDATVVAAFSPDPAISADARGPLEDALLRDMATVLAKLRRAHAGGFIPSYETFVFASRHYATAMTDRSGLLGLPSDLVLLAIAVEALDSLPLSEALDVLSRAKVTETGVLIRVEACARARQEARLGEAEMPEWAEAFEPEVITTSVNYVQAMSTEPLPADCRPLTRIIWWLSILVGVEETRALVWDIVEAPDGWDLLSFLAVLVPVGTGSSGGSRWESIGDLESHTLDTFFGLDRLLASDRLPLGPHVQVDSWSRRRMEPTVQNRIRYALGVVDNLKDRGDSSQLDVARAAAGSDVTSNLDAEVNPEPARATEGEG